MKFKTYIKPFILFVCMIGLLAVCVIKSHAAHSALNTQKNTVVSDLDTDF
jgi:hypothetical protein